MAEINEDGYALLRHPGETQRLHLQNIILNRVVGYELHPTIMRRLPAEPQIADLATATGDFVASLAPKLPPKATLHGYDVSSVCFLPKEQLPSNVSLEILDSKEPVPAELQGKYDAVCIRYFNAALMPEDWPKVAAHVAQLLKPGGLVQWIETNFFEVMTVHKDNPSTKNDVLEACARRALSGTSQHRLAWFEDNLETVLKNTGFEILRHDVTSTDRDEGDIEAQKMLRRNVTWLNEGAMYSIFLALARKAVHGMPSERETEELHEAMLAEIEGGAYLKTNLHQFVAFKKS